MTAAVADARSSPAHAAPLPVALRKTGADLAAPGQRGELTIDPKVVEKIAAHAAGEVKDVGGAARRVLNVAVGSDDRADHARVEALVDGRTVVVDVQCSITYPSPVATVSQRLREHLTSRIGELTGLDVAQIDITVVALTTPGSGSSTSGRGALL